MKNKLKSGKLWERIVFWSVSLCLIGAARLHDGHTAHHAAGQLGDGRSA